MLFSTSAQQKAQPHNVLIIGCGDIGLRLARNLDSNRYIVTGLKRSPTPDLNYLKYRSCDATNRETLATVLNDQFDVVVITMTPDERSDAGYRRAYVDTCANLAQSLANHSQWPGLIMFVSSTGVYAQSQGEWVDEQSVTQPDSYSGRRLLEAEQIIQQSGIANCIVRFSGIYGPGRHRLIEQVIQRRASASTHFTNRIHADDCAGVLTHLIERHFQDQKLAPLYVATDNSPTPMIEVVSWIAAQLRLENFLAEDALNERGNKKMSNSLLVDSGYRFRYPDFRSGYAEMLERYLSDK